MPSKWTQRFELKPGRWVFSPTDESRAWGEKVKRVVDKHWNPPHFYYHLRSGGHVAAIQRHAPSKYFFRTDLDSFFYRVNLSRLTRHLKTWLPYKVAREMACRSVVKVPGSSIFTLPYGFVQSPVLASLALDRSRLGAYLRSLDAGGAVLVSIYVDDIIVSGQSEKAIQAISLAMGQIADASAFPLSVGKSLCSAGVVTAFNIELLNGTTRIIDARLVQFKDEFRATSSAEVREGIFSYVASVNPGQAATL
ncbi:MAG: hypothetical protein DI587_03330 [Variovorax paradoxus]|nr:MAG: hypothetical protein DI583_03330 [Variovorax paradoxus]PZQ15730.1 MAG: hypothetical protein DI587_03330 [Variovorax paradoxus]